VLETKLRSRIGFNQCFGSGSGFKHFRMYEYLVSSPVAKALKLLQMKSHDFFPYNAIFALLDVALNLESQ